MWWEQVCVGILVDMVCEQTKLLIVVSFFFNDTATTEIYTLSLHDALPIWGSNSNAGNRSKLYVMPIRLILWGGYLSFRKTEDLGF